MPTPKDPDRASSLLPFAALLLGAYFVLTNSNDLSPGEAGAVLVILGSQGLDAAELRNVLLARLPRKRADGSNDA